MTNPTITQRSIAALAALAHDTRAALGIEPTWNEPGIAAELRKHTHVPLHALTHATIRAATDPANTTPAVLSQPTNRAWDNDHAWRCPTHPHERARRVNGECGGCYADRKAVTTHEPPRRVGVPPQPDTRAAIHAAIRHPHPQDDAHAAPTP